MADRENPIIDVQIHMHERNHPGRPWSAEPRPSWVPRSDPHGPEEVTGADMVRAMDEVGVDAAVNVSPWGVYRYDISYAVRMAEEFPERFRVVAPVDPTEPTIVDTLSWLAGVPSIVGVRVMMGDPDLIAAAVDGEFRAVFHGAARHGLPVAVLAWDLVSLAKIASAHPETRFLVDHLGMKPSLTPPPPADPFSALPDLLKLSHQENVVVKVTAVPVLANEPFPYPDIWPRLEQVFTAFGLDRCAWGSDWTRALPFLPYRDGLDYIRLSGQLTTAEKAQLLGGTSRSVYRWPAGT